MKEWMRKSRYVRLGLTLFCAASAVLIFFRIVADFDAVRALFSTIAGILMPFIVGLTLAYILSPIYDSIERVCVKALQRTSLAQKTKNTLSKATASVAAVLVIVAVIGGLIGAVIPQVYASIVKLIETFPQKQAAFEVWIMTVGDMLGTERLQSGLVEVFRAVTDAFQRWANESLVPNLASFAVQGMGYVADIIGAVINVLVGVIICVYVLGSKRVFAAQSKKLLYSLFETSTANHMLRLTRYIHRTFGRFINGMLLDALMVGAVCFAGMALLKIPYASLVSVVVGVLNVVPVFGPIIAAAIGAFFVLLDDPFKALVFLVFVLILQQIDGNIIAPKILGEKTGLRGFWVIFAIVVGGGVFGFVGMILGVPTFAVIYALFRRRTEDRLTEKHFPPQTEAYDGLWDVDECSLEPRYAPPVSTDTDSSSDL